MFCVERVKFVKFVKFGEREGGGVRSEEWIGRQSGDGAAAEGCGGVKTPPYEAKGKRVA